MRSSGGGTPAKPRRSAATIVSGSPRIGVPERDVHPERLTVDLPREAALRSEALADVLEPATPDQRLRVAVT
jgi:hypothetical protein